MTAVRDLLVERFGFATGGVRCLVEGARPQDRPTRASIVRDMEALVREARAGDRVVLDFSGLGSQQPDRQPPDSGDPEPDGLDEILLPAEADRWDAAAATVRNAIVDDEVRAWSDKLLAAGVELLLIVDACHAAAAVRSGEVARHLAAEDLTPAELLGAARRRAVAACGGAAAAESASIDLPADGNWVAFAAAQPHDAAVEATLPPDIAERRPMGLFTYLLVKTMRQAGPISPRTLAARLQGEQMAMSRFASSPGIRAAAPDLCCRAAGRGPPASPSTGRPAIAGSPPACCTAAPAERCWRCARTDGRSAT